MELELKYLAPYLPYKLKLVARNVISETPRKIYSELTAMNIMSLVEEDTLYKPILRNLSDLTNKNSSELKSKYQINNDIIFWIQELTVKNTNIKYLTVEAYTFLLEHHFDTFDLIKNGLAIDMNTL